MVTAVRYAGLGFAIMAGLNALPSSHRGLDKMNPVEVRRKVPCVLSYDHRSTPSHARLSSVKCWATLREAGDYERHFSDFLAVSDLTRNKELEANFLKDLMQAGIADAAKELPDAELSEEELQEAADFWAHAHLTCLVWASYLPDMLDCIGASLPGWDMEVMGHKEGSNRLVVFYPEHDSSLAILAVRGVGDDLGYEVYNLANAAISKDPFTKGHHAGVSLMVWEIFGEVMASVLERNVTRFSMAGHSLGGSMVTVMSAMLADIKECQERMDRFDRLSAGLESGEFQMMERKLDELTKVELAKRNYLLERTGLNLSQWEQLAKIQCMPYLAISDPPVSPKGQVDKAIRMHINGDPVSSIGGFVPNVLGEGPAALIGGHFEFPKRSIEITFGTPSSASGLDSTMLNMSGIDQSLASFEGVDPLVEYDETVSPDEIETVDKIESSQREGFFSRVSKATQRQWSRAGKYMGDTRDYFLDYREHYIGRVVMHALIEHCDEHCRELEVSDILDLLPKSRLWSSKICRSWKTGKSSLSGTLESLMQSMPDKTRVWSNAKGDHFIAVVRNMTLHGYLDNGALHLEVNNAIFSRPHGFLDEVAESLLS